MTKDKVVSLIGVRAVQRTDRYRLAAKAIIARSLGLIVRDISMGSFSMTEEPGTGALLFLMPEHPTDEPQPLRSSPTYVLLALECARHAVAMVVERADDEGVGTVDDYDADNMASEEAERLVATVFPDEGRQSWFTRATWADTVEFLVANWQTVERLAAKLDGDSILAEDVPSLEWPSSAQ